MPSFKVFKGSKVGRIVEDLTTRPDLTGDQVYVRIAASGLCGTDEHYKNTPMALGHEGIGVVEQLGPDAKTLKNGDRVGWGYEHDCCGHCHYCLSGQEIFCSKRAMYGEADLDQGSMGHGAVWRESFLFKIPEGISDEDAAPLMCGGATVFSALQCVEDLQNATVGVVGVGGLGHLAIQFAAKAGADVVVFSGTDSKKEQAEKLGAKEFVTMKGKSAEEMTKLAGTEIPKVDALLVTTNQIPDWSLYIPILANLAHIFPLPVDFGDFKFPNMDLILKGIKIQGSLVANRETYRKMIAFAARNGVKPMNNIFPMTTEGIEEAFSVLEKGEMRYRGVLVPESSSNGFSNGNGHV